MRFFDRFRFKNWEIFMFLLALFRIGLSALEEQAKSASFLHCLQSNSMALVIGAIIGIAAIFILLIVLCSTASQPVDGKSSSSSSVAHPNVPKMQIMPNGTIQQQKRQITIIKQNEAPMIQQQYADYPQQQLPYDNGSNANPYSNMPTNAIVPYAEPQPQQNQYDNYYNQQPHQYQYQGAYPQDPSYQQQNAYNQSNQYANYPSQPIQYPGSCHAQQPGGYY